MKRPALVLAGAIAAIAIAAVVGRGLLGRRGPALDPASPEYQQITSVFYRGLASLDTGLLDTAKSSFTTVTELAPEEPAGWANLGIAHLRMSELEPAARAIDSAVARAPRDGRVALLHGALEIARGQVDAAIADLERAVALDPDGIRPRFALADALERARGDAAAQQAQQLLDEILARQPSNLAVLVDRARLAARRSDGAALQAALGRLTAQAAGWPESAAEQLAALQTAVGAGDFQASGRAIAFLRNVLARVPAYRESLAAARVPAELIAEPFDRFLTLPPPQSRPSPADPTLAFTPTPLQLPAGFQAAAMTLALADADATPLLLVGDGRVARVPGRDTAVPAVGTVLLALDWNHDFRSDVLVAGEAGVRLLQQGDGGTFTDTTAALGRDPFLRAPAAGAWAADVEMDGDIDAVIGLTQGDPVVLRNNGDGSMTPTRPFPGAGAARGFGWGDLDRDGDPDAVVLDAGGRIGLFLNQQAGQFAKVALPDGGTAPARAVSLGDADADGTIDLIALDTRGAIRRITRAGDEWDSRQVADWAGADQTHPGDLRLIVADLDNNGAVDLVASGSTGSRIWLAAEDGRWQPHATLEGTTVFAARDLDTDGQIDLVGRAGSAGVVLRGAQQQRYHWQVVRPRAQTTAGDQRVNSFGVGGEIEVRSGLLVQKQLLDGGPVHIGLGTRRAIDVARIVWPNGVMQAEFELTVDQAVVAEQRLKGSCPWVFAWDGSEMGFVTDFLWRSPLGLRINAQDTAGISQTEDWVTIRGDQLVPRDGRYDVRITAELWETHFFDHVSLLVVDHPADRQVAVDERFARTPPVPGLHPTTTPRPVSGAWDDQGREVTALVERRDGRHVAGFERGDFQGVTRDHTLVFTLGDDAPATGPLWLVATGWVYPTDSSINVAIAQGRHPAPQGLVLDVQLADGSWTLIDDGIGFPAGKNKTILVDLGRRPAGARRFRLRTNMEIYWDALGYASPVPDAPRTTRLAPLLADLRYRGYSRTTQDWEAHGPEVPHYAQLSNTAPRWRDLVGYHTRFGDVRELLESVDDRYVIMNAGDEMRLSFAAPAPPADGWVRDFVLIGDGWEKDGDFNTGFSRTVQPLPLHDHPEYTAPEGDGALERDPAYRRHPEDWQRFHTRFVAPDLYLRGLRR